jgi:hypothetical protein
MYSTRPALRPDRQHHPDQFRLQSRRLLPGLFKLDESLDAEQPIGLKKLGDWPTLYQGLSAAA